MMVERKAARSDIKWVTLMAALKGLLSVECLVASRVLE